VEAPATRRKRSFRGPIIDCDVHHNWPNHRALHPYLSAGWRDFVLGPGRQGDIPLTAAGFYNVPNGNGREDTVPETGEPAGTSLELMREQLLDRYGIERALLTYGDGLFGISGMTSPYLATEVARAANDWTAEQWLAQDRRLYGSILVANQLPEGAAAEIRRWSVNDRMPQVIMAGSGVGKPLGHPVYHPIYEAAVDAGKVVAIHIGGQGGTQPFSTGGGPVNFYFEYHALLFQPLITHLVSLIAHGVFEKFPDLRVMLLECGVAWLPGVLWRLDTDYRSLRREVPWVKRLPSEYVMQHCRISTQPIEDAPRREQLIQLLECIDGRRMLCFATDYPHWDTDDPDHVAARMPSDWWQSVYHDNACRFYGWPVAASRHRESVHAG
jgi:predicted TIM-barrel fold metal-dependent hydrolase